MTCLLNVNYVGYTNALFGVLGGVFSLICGYTARFTTLTPQIIMKYCLSTALAIFILCWKINIDSSLKVTVSMVSVLAITESIATVQIRGLSDKTFFKPVLNLKIVNLQVFMAYISPITRVLLV